MVLENVLVVRLDHFQQKEHEPMPAHVFCLVLVSRQPSECEFRHTRAYILQAFCMLRQTWIAVGFAEGVGVANCMEFVNNPYCVCKPHRCHGFLTRVAMRPTLCNACFDL